MSSRELEDRREQEIDQEVAHALGISVEEYAELEIDLEPVETNDDMTVGYNVYFLDGSDPTVLAKITGAKIGGFVRIGLIALDDPDDEY